MAETIAERRTSTPVIFANDADQIPGIVSATSGVGLASDLRDYIQSNLTRVVTPDAGELTIVSGAITVTGKYHTVDAEADAASDVLDAIAGGVDGAHLILQAEHTDRSIVVTRSSTIKLSAATITLADTESTIAFIYSGALSAWVELSNSTNA